MLRELEDVMDLLAWVQAVPTSRKNLDRAINIVDKLVDQLRAEDARREQDAIRRSAQEVECAVIKKAVGREQLTTLHRTLDSALSELRELLAQDETIEASLACELLGNAVDQLLALERTISSNPVQTKNDKVTQ